MIACSFSLLSFVRCIIRIPRQLLFSEAGRTPSQITFKHLKKMRFILISEKIGNFFIRHICLCDKFYSFFHFQLFYILMRGDSQLFYKTAV